MASVRGNSKSLKKGSLKQEKNEQDKEILSKNKYSPTLQRIKL